MHWTRAVELLRRERRAGVLVTVVDVRGHAPRDAGAKMVVASDDVWGTIGGGNLEETVLQRARAMLDRQARRLPSSSSSDSPTRAAPTTAGSAAAGR